MFLAFLIGTNGLAFTPPECRVLMKKLVDHLVTDGAYGEPLELGPQATSQKPVALKLHPGKRIELIRDRFIDFGKTDWHDPDAIYIGVASHFKEGQHHFYMIAGNVRMDGPGDLGPTKIHESKEGKVPLATDGVLFKISVGKDKRAEVMKAMLKEKNATSLNCLVPVVKVLRQAGIELESFDTNGELSATAVGTNLMFGQIKIGKDHPKVAALATSSEALENFAITSETIDETAIRKGQRGPIPKEK